MAEIIDSFYIDNQSKAAYLFDLLVKNYKVESANIYSEGNKIIWVNGLYRHTICVNGGKFLVDGYDIYINYDLWDKYVKLRQLMGAIYIKAPKKIDFPYDWSEMSDDQVLENIDYLIKNYKEYKITFQDEKCIKIDNVTIKVCDDRDKNKYCHRYYVINNKKYYRETEAGKQIIDLIMLCKNRVMSFKEKFARWWKNNKNISTSVIITGSVTVILIGCLGVFGNYMIKQVGKKEKPKTVQKFYDTFKQEQAKTVNIFDTSKQNLR